MYQDFINLNSFLQIYLSAKGIFLHLMHNTGKWIALKFPKNPNEMNCVNLQKLC